MNGAAALPAVVLRPGYGPMNSRMKPKYAASSASSRVSATTSSTTAASCPVTAFSGSTGPRTPSSPKMRVDTFSRPSAIAPANRSDSRSVRSAPSVHSRACASSAGSRTPSIEIARKPS